MSNSSGVIANYVNCLREIESQVRSCSYVFEIDQFGTISSSKSLADTLEVCPGEFLLFIGMYYEESHLKFDVVFVDDVGDPRDDDEIKDKVFRLNSSDISDLVPGFGDWFAATYNTTSDVDSIGSIEDLEIELLRRSTGKPMIREKFEEAVNKHELVEAEQARKKAEEEQDFYASDTEGLGLF